MQRATTAAIALVLVTAPVPAQGPQPYAGLEQRQLKALSDGEVADLRAGRGMGLALVAELNGYPGPVHVLELADALALSPPQHARMSELLAAMKAEAIPLGERLIEVEAELDRQFAGKTITEDTLATAVGAIGAAQAALRAAHLKYHLVTAEVLTPAQIERYRELRGYSGGSHGGHHRPGQRH